MNGRWFKLKKEPLTSKRSVKHQGSGEVFVGKQETLDFWTRKIQKQSLELNVIFFASIKKSGIQFLVL